MLTALDVTIVNEGSEQNAAAFNPSQLDVGEDKSCCEDTNLILAIQ